MCTVYCILKNNIKIIKNDLERRIKKILRHKVNQKVKDLTIPGIRYFSNKVLEYDDGINLTIGEPDFPTPDHIKRAGMKAIADDETVYSHNAGMFELRAEVSNYFKDKYQFYYCPDDEIIVTNGASQGIDAVLRTILKEDDEVILPAPIYSGYEPTIHLLGAKKVYLDTTNTNFLPDVNELEGMISNKTKAIIFNYPSNPTGAIIDRKTMDNIVSLLKKHRIFIISDEIYSENTFGQKHISFASYKEIREQLFLIHGLSKSHAMTGWRIGFILGPQILMNEVLKVHLNNIICVSLPNQFAALEAVKNGRHDSEEMNGFYIERRELLYAQSLQFGFSMVKPSGAFYLFPSIRFTGLTSTDFATELLQSEHVAVVPGSAFSPFGEGFIRISYANSMDNLKEGMKRIERFVYNLT